MNVNDMKPKILCVSCQNFNEKFSKCDGSRRCAIIQRGVVILPWTREETYINFKSGIIKKV